MKEIDKYIEKITKDLPDEEREELREEMAVHLEEHVKELLIHGYREEDAVRYAIDSFGDGGKLNQEFKRTFFPTYRVVRFAWGVMWTVASFCLFSHLAMEYYRPEYDSGISLNDIWWLTLYIAPLAGAGELMHGFFQTDFKWKWILNPWVFFLVPAFMISGLQSTMLFIEPERYQDGRWLDLLAVAKGGLVYVVARQLFDGLFLGGNKAKRNVVK
ncbi:permease prefix domain 1-containing protein [Halobacillus litoralis]|uniref:permease prefix domain 1-containing protein n=1 Tax=Halobacillus litoralis TaxID=45668 RepID=UPI001CD66CDD|nr:permease prefix domain 1-containing protein [Halobacillus litoralis]MCA0970843.1 permease prefix domain 1-containing protein [Halobacillus litoralis]